MRYCSDFSKKQQAMADDYVFGRMLKSEFDEETIAHFCSNSPLMLQGTKTSPFDLTEEKNSKEALELLRTAII
jgi:hypothetical protein